ncbi:MAG: hypothetical protein LBV74_20805 [Tannerella sp.]|nr:hypothetical protein [Tannerella sp.]
MQQQCENHDGGHQRCSHHQPYRSFRNLHKRVGAIVRDNGCEPSELVHLDNGSVTRFHRK